MADLKKLMTRSSKVYDLIINEQKKDNPDSKKLQKLEKEYEQIQDQIAKIYKDNG